MDERTGQKIDKTELQTLILKSQRQFKLKTVMEVGKVFILPLTLAAITWRVNVQQAKNTERLALEQIKSAQIIAEANREHSSRISESNQRIQRIKHIKDIFTKIITKQHQTTEAVAMEIRSLEVYKSDALSFLLNIRAHFNHQQENGIRGNGRGLDYGEIVAQTDQTISNILQNSPIDVSGREFFRKSDPSKKGPEALEGKKNADAGDMVAASEMAPDGGTKKTIREYGEMIRSFHGGISTSWKKEWKKMSLPEGDISQAASLAVQGTEKANMRKQKYYNYNFSGSTFVRINLYQAQFSNCTLKGTIFIDVDLQEASFSESDLSQAIFINCNLKRVNFSKARLRDALILNPVRERKDGIEVLEEAAKSKARDGATASVSKEDDPATGDGVKDSAFNDRLFCELEDAQFSLGTLLNTNYLPFYFIRDKTDDLRREWIRLYINLLVPHRHKLASMGAEADDDFDALIKHLGMDTPGQLQAALIREEKRLEKHAHTIKSKFSQGGGIQLGLSQ